MAREHSRKAGLVKLHLFAGLKTGISWDDLPAEFGCGCVKACRHYLQLWRQVGVWEKLHLILLAELNVADQVEWSRALIDVSALKAPEGGDDTGPNPTDRDKSGGHLMTDAKGIPLSATLTGANGPDVVEALHLVTSMPEVGGKPGPKRQKPERLQGNRGYDSEPLRQELRCLGITPAITERGT